MLYDADRMEEVANLPDDELVEGQRSMIVNPHDPQIIEEARKNGIHDSVIESAQKSPIYKFVKEWKIALPAHIEYRTLPMLFYVPPMSPVQATKEEDVIDHTTENLFHDIDSARVPMKFLQIYSVLGKKVRFDMHWPNRRLCDGYEGLRQLVISLRKWQIRC